MPPAAAMIGSAALCRSDSAPLTNSRLISAPTSRKKIAIRPSLIQCDSVLLIASGPRPSVNGASKKAKY